jgi:acetolactate synthase I/II/III large subunit
MKISDFIIDTLAAEGVTHIFEICGGALGHLLDSLYGRTDIRAISMHHEMAAAIAAEGYARAGENFGVAMATSGPGATNLITGIGSCFFDSIPCVFITGQVNTYEYKFDKPVRQIGFQETDIVSIVKPLVKSATLIIHSEEIGKVLSGSIDTARSGRPGPVLLDVPLNIQRSETKEKPSRKTVAHIPESATLEIPMENEIRLLIKSSSRPVILAGGGVRSAKATKELSEFARANGIPVVSSLMGLDSFPHDDPLFVGMIGTYGNRYANLTVANADLLIALGTRFDTRQTGTLPQTFARGATIIHVDIDAPELNSKIRVKYPINMDIRAFLQVMNRKKTRHSLERMSAWYEIIRSYKSRYPVESLPATRQINPYAFLKQVAAALPNNAIICTDVGQNQMWAAQTMEIKGGQRFLTQGGMASIGSALPIAIGASFAKPGQMIIVITGDGGFQLNIQELQTVVHHTLPVKILLLNNSGYGMIRQFQEQYFDSRFQSSVIGYSNPDFQKVVGAYSITSNKISETSEVVPALSSLFKDLQPGFLEVIIDEKFRVSPKLAVNRPVEDQEPLLSREELQSNMLIGAIRENDAP